MTEKSLNIDVIVPCYNPQKNWELRLIGHLDNLKKANTNYSYRLILVNDGSTNQYVNDTTLGFVKAANTHTQIHSYPNNKGKGYALRKGTELAQSPIQVFTDIDFPYTTQSILAIIEKLSEGYDAALGFREENYYQKVPLFRKWLSKTFRFVLKNLLKFKVTDTQCGLKGFTAKGKTLFLQTRINRFLFDMEFVRLLSTSKNINLCTVKVQLRDNITFSTMPPIILIKESLNFFTVLWRKA
jgi:glycosyltransferase involved in cell wall biosynthesis